MNFRQPPEGMDVVWRCDARSYSYVIDADAERYGSTAPRLEFDYYPVDHRTPKGAYVGGVFYLLTAKRSPYRNTREEAFASFKRRREVQISILERQLARAKYELALTETELT